MADYDDRPISVYDNLNAMNMPSTAALTTTTTKPTMHTSTPKTKTTNGAGFPYDEEMTFKLRDKTKNRQQQQQQHLLPNGQSQTHQKQHQQQQQQQQQSSSPLPQIQFALHQPGVALYSTPVKPLIAQATTTTTNALATPATLATDRTDTSAQRPLSQHSQSELNEASHSIAAIKAALNDAKSKFFGLNGYAQDTNDAPIVSTNGVQAYNLLNNNNNNNNNNTNTFEQHRPKVQIVSPVRSQPKYQNIPENSAIYRQQQHEDQPPALPPKPAIYSERQKSNSPERQHLMATASPPASQSATPSPHSGRNSSNTTTSQQLPQMIQNSPLAASPYELSSAAPSQSGLTEVQQPATSPVTYKQLPLNDLDLGPQPSQAVYMSTTVPQNIKGSKIAGRHTPTRNSLRHSRMLVVNNKNYQGVQHPNPMNFKYPNLARWLLILQTLLGVLLIFLAIWMFFLAPNAKIQDNPYWSGLTLILAGSIGLVLVRFARIKRHKARENCFHFLRADSYLLSLVAVLLCGVALTCAAIHFARLTASDTRCVSSNILLEHGSCACTFHARNLENDKAYDGIGWLDEGPADEDLKEQGERSYTIEYRDLSCQEVTGEWIFLLSASMALNVLGLIVSLLFLILLICCRQNSKRFYSSVHTSTF